MSKDLVQMFILIGLSQVVWAGTSAQDPLTSSLRDKYTHAAIYRDAAQFKAMLGNWECNSRSALWNDFSSSDYSPLYEFSLWQGLMTDHASDDSRAHTYISSNWGFLGVLGTPGQMDVDSLRFLPNGNIVAERILNTAFFNDRPELGERAVSHPEYIVHGYAECRKIPSAGIVSFKYESPDTNLLSLVRGFKLVFKDQDFPFHNPANNSAFVVQNANLYPGIWAWRGDHFVVMTDIENPSSDVALSEKVPSCQVHLNPSRNSGTAKLEFKAMKFVGNLHNANMFNALSAPDEAIFLNCLLPALDSSTQKTFLVSDLQNIWGLKLLGIESR